LQSIKHAAEDSRPTTHDAIGGKGTASTKKKPRPCAGLRKSALSYLTYAPTVQSELFYTDMEKHQAQRHRC